MSFKHTEETDARIRRGYEAGELVSGIAAELGVTRNVIIGRARRIGLAKAGRQLEASKTPEALAKLRAASKRSWDSSDPERRIETSIRLRRMHREDKETHEKIIAALREGYERYTANRKANHSANLASERAE